MKILKQSILILLILIFTRGLAYGHDAYKDTDNLLLNNHSFLYVNHKGLLRDALVLNPKLPKIPERPDVVNLANLNNKEPEIKRVRIKNLNLNENLIHNDSKTLKAIQLNKKKYIKELLFNANTQKLFGTVLNLAKTLDVTVKSFDTTQGQILIVDKYRNKLLLNISSDTSTVSKLKIFARRSILGRHSFDQAVTDFLSKLSSMANS